MDGWFPRLSPTGRRVMRGATQLSVDGVVVAGPPAGGLSGAWLDETTLLYRRHDTGALVRYDLTTHQATPAGPVCDGVSAGGGIWAWGRSAPAPAIETSDGRRWVGYGGGPSPVHVAQDGTVVMGRHDDGALVLVPPRETGPVRLDAAGGVDVRSSPHGITYARAGRVFVADWATLTPQDVTLPGEAEYGPVLVSTAEGPWLVTHTASLRLLARPLGSTRGVVVAEGETFHPDAAAVQDALRVVWAAGDGTPHEAWVALSAPRVELAAPAVWHPVGTTVDTLPFLVPDYAGTLRCPQDGQTLQSVRTGPREVTCLKGSPERQERWRWDDQAVYLTYDASDGRDQPWRVAPEPVWAPRVAQVGDSQVYQTTRLVRRTATGGSEAHPFPVRTAVVAYGEHIPVDGIGRCRLLTTTWEPGYPDSGYQERHWWAIREADGLRLGRVRYEEWRHGALARAFDFSQLLPDVRLAPAPRLEIPDPPAPWPDPAPTPEPPTMPTPEPTITDDEFANAGARVEHRYAAWGRPGREVQTDPLSYRWMVDYYVLRRAGRDHEAALREVERRMDVAAGVEAPAPAPGPAPPPANGLVGPLRVA